MRPIAPVLIIVAALILAACLPVSSRVPVGSKAGFSDDPALSGVWKTIPEGEDKPGTIEFRRSGRGAMTAILIDNDGRGEWSVQTARIAGNRFISARETIDDGKPSTGPLAERYTLLLYRMAGKDELTLYTMDEDATRAAIRAGVIAGAIERGQDGDVRITAGQPALDTFMGTQRAARLFTKRLVTLQRKR